MKNLLLYLLVQLSVVFVLGQTKNFSVFDSSLARFERNYPQEKYLYKLISPIIMPETLCG